MQLSIISIYYITYPCIFTVPVKSLDTFLAMGFVCFYCFLHCRNAKDIETMKKKSKKQKSLELH